MTDSVSQLRSRWTAETTAQAIAFLQGGPPGPAVAVMEHNGKTHHDLRGIRIEQIQLDGRTIKNVNLRWSTICDVGFKDTRLVKCNLSQTEFSECYFRRTHFERCDVVNAKFDSCDFSNAHISGSRLDFAIFRTCEITLNAIEFRADANPQVLVRVCRNLKLNAMSMGHFADAGELTYMEKTYDRRALYQHAFGRRHETLRVRLGSVWNWTGSLVLNWLWGYGEKPNRLALVMLANILAFGTLQYWLDGLPGKAWWECLYFSGITFLTVGYGDLVPLAELPRFLAVLEGAAGIATFGMLIAAATKKIMYR
jgi:Ion channel/Pentapeptide repeats (9 copies)